MGQSTAEVRVGHHIELAGRPSFDDWAHESSARLLRLAVLVGHEQHAARDAVQDALLAVLVRWHRLQEPGAADAYARRVVINRRISWWRRIGRRESTAEQTEGGGHEADTTDAVLARQLVVSLTGVQRAAVVLRFFDDLSFAEIAEILGCAEATARSHVHRALARLRTQLQEEA